MGRPEYAEFPANTAFHREQLSLKSCYKYNHNPCQSTFPLWRPKTVPYSTIRTMREFIDNCYHVHICTHTLHSAHSKTICAKLPPTVLHTQPLQRMVVIITDDRSGIHLNRTRPSNALSPPLGIMRGKTDVKMSWVPYTNVCGCTNSAHKRPRPPGTWPSVTERHQHHWSETRRAVTVWRKASTLLVSPAYAYSRRLRSEATPHTAHDPNVSLSRTVSFLHAGAGSCSQLRAIPPASQPGEDCST